MAQTLEASAQAAPLALAVAFCGERSRALLGGWVSELPAAALADDSGPARLDALAIDAAPSGLTRSEARRAIDAAKERGARVIGVADTEREPVFGDRADVVFSELSLIHI